MLDAAYLARHDAKRVEETSWHMMAEKEPQMPHLRHTVSETAAAAIIELLKTLKD